MSNFINALSERVNRGVEYLSMGFFAVLIISCSLQVFSRYVLNHSLSWTEELARHSYIWIVLLGASICVKRASHATVTVLVDVLPSKLRYFIGIVANVLVIGGASIMLYQGIKILPVTIRQLSPANQVPMGLIYIAVPISGLCILLHKLADFTAGRGAK